MIKQAEQDARKTILFICIAIILGAIAGGIVWLFLKASEAGLFFLWEVLPSRFDTIYYPLIICTVGGMIIGLMRRKFGNYPQNLEEVMETVKAKGRYDSCRIYALFLMALFPIIFGGSIGPEAGMVCVIAALCTWVGDRFKYSLKETKELAQIGISASLGIVFTAPLFGFLEQVEGEAKDLTFPGRTKVLIYFSAILSGLGLYLLLSSFFGGGLHFDKFEVINTGRIEILWFVPLALVGFFIACSYNIIGALLRIVTKPFQRFPVTLAVLAGILLGICGMFLPLILFSGETNIAYLTEGTSFLIIGLIKLIAINLCLQTGWRGGNIIPLIFTSVCFAYGVSSFAGINSVFAAAVVSTVVCAVIIRKPIAVAILMLIFFPIKSILLLTAAAIAGAYLRKLLDFIPQLPGKPI